MLLFYIAFEMIFERRTGPEGEERGDGAGRPHPQRRDLSARHPADLPARARSPPPSSSPVAYARFAPAGSLLILIVAINLAIAWLVFLAADRIEHLLGATGRIVLTRLLGLILAALAVQFVADGVLAFARG